VLTRPDPKSPWMPRTRDQSIDRQIDEWSGGSPVSVKEVHPNCKFDVSEDNCTMICTLVYAVVYQLMPGYKKDVMARPGKLPLWARGTPCIEAMDGISGQPITVMAGIFGVPEGAPLAIDDDEPAPKPMLSPDFVLLTYSDLFKPSSEGDNDERDCYEEPLYAGGKREIPLPACS
jgi:hypothetical protein